MVLTGEDILHGDCFQLLPQLPEACVDLVFCDPPYNLSLGNTRLRRWGRNDIVTGVREEWDRFESFEEYDRFLRELFLQCRRVMKPQATLWAIGTYHCIHRIGAVLQDLGFWLLGDVVWLKPNPMPNWLGVRFSNAVETLIWAVPHRKVKGYKFHLDVACEYSEGKLATNVWRIPVCRGRERTEHPTQKPEELLERILRICTDPGDLVLDPMAGSGTTAAVAQRLKRRFIVMERDPSYVNIIRRRLAQMRLEYEL